MGWEFTSRLFFSTSIHPSSEPLFRPHFLSLPSLPLSFLYCLGSLFLCSPISLLGPLFLFLHLSFKTSFLLGSSLSNLLSSLFTIFYPFSFSIIFFLNPKFPSFLSFPFSSPFYASPSTVCPSFLLPVPFFLQLNSSSSNSLLIL